MAAQEARRVGDADPRRHAQQLRRVGDARHADVDRQLDACDVRTRATHRLTTRGSKHRLLTM